MLFWPKFLTIAHGVATSVHVFLPLYFFHLLHFSYYQIGILLSIALTTRMVGDGFWAAWVDQRDPMLHGVLTSLITALGAASLVLVLSIPPTTWLSWPAAILCMILDGWFFQPLGCLIDSAIIKILGDYKLLFESERRWGKLSLGITALGIGCFLDDDHDFDTLMGTVVIGCAALFLLSLSTTAQPADPFLLGLSSSPSLEEERCLEASPLLLSKSSMLPQYLHGDDTATMQHMQHPQRFSIHHQYHHHHHSNPPSSKNYKRNYGQDNVLYQETANVDHYSSTRRPTAPISLLDSTSSSCFYYHHTSYKPYNLFGDHLSHISEEDVSMLQRIPSTPPRAPSIISTKTNNSVNHLLDNSTFQFASMPLPPSTATASPPTPLPFNPPGAGIHSSSPIQSSNISLESQHSPRSPIPSSPPLSIQQPLGRVEEGLYGKYDSPTTSNAMTVTSTLQDTSFKSMALALLPFPPGDIPMIVLITHFPRLRPEAFHPRQRSQRVDEQDKSGEEYEEQPSYNLLIMANSFILGLVYAPMILWSPLIYCDYFGLPMHTIGLMILTGCLTDIIVTHSAPLALEHLSLRKSVLLAHLVLMISIFAYAWMPVGQQWWSLICLVVLHVAQSSSIQVVWLMASCQVDLLFLPHCQDRMMLRGKMSALYSSFGPAVASVILGWMISLGWTMSSIYLCTLILVPISASLTLGWS